MALHNEQRNDFIRSLTANRLLVFGNCYKLLTLTFTLPRELTETSLWTLYVQLVPRLPRFSACRDGRPMEISIPWRHRLALSTIAWT
jgi:hypothetical protein